MNRSRSPVTCVTLLMTALIAACSAGGSTPGHTEGAGGDQGSSRATTGTGKGSGSGAGGDISLGSGGAAASGSGAGGAASCDAALAAQVRDFSNNHPDFAKFLGDDPGIVKPDLGADGKPVYNGNPTTPTTTGQANFDQWYRDVSGVNIPFMIKLPLTPGGKGVYTYDNQSYFPIDGQGFGDEFQSHNYSFTTEIHTQFTYKGGEVFTFTGDDDLFAFINKKLVINLGGVHTAETGSVDLDKVAGQVGIVVGNTYPLDLFGAERHPSESHFRIDTTIECFTPPPPPK